jgi:polyhydroxybutyrate depolymerase
MIGRILMLGIFMTLAVFAANVPFTNGQRDEMTFEEIDVDGVMRTYGLFLPSSYEESIPLPLVLAFHPAGGDAASFAFRTGFNELAERDQVIVVYPEGPQGYWDYGVGLPGWETMGPLNDDVGFVEALLDYLVGHYAVDEDQIYAVGHSNGARMVHRVGCEFADRLAGIAAVSGTISTEVTEACPNEARLSVLYMQGTEDETIPWEGKPLRDDSGSTIISYALSAPDTIEFWADKNGCDTDEPTITDSEDLNAGDEITVRRVSFNGCEDDQQVVFYVVLGGGHGWLGGRQNLTPSNYMPSGNATDFVWEFFGFGRDD